MSTGAYRKAYLFAWWEGGEWKQRRPPKAVAVVLHSEGYMFPTFSSSCRANVSRGYLHIGVWPVPVLGSPLTQVLTVWTLRYVSAHSPDPACFTCVCTWRHGIWSREALRGDNGPEDRSFNIKHLNLLTGNFLFLRWIKRYVTFLLYITVTMTIKKLRKSFSDFLCHSRNPTLHRHKKNSP